MRAPHFFLNLTSPRGRVYRARDHVPLPDQPGRRKFIAVDTYLLTAEVDHDHHCEEYRVGP